MALQLLLNQCFFLFSFKKHVGHCSVLFEVNSIRIQDNQKPKHNGPFKKNNNELRWSPVISSLLETRKSFEMMGVRDNKVGVKFHYFSIWTKMYIVYSVPIEKVIYCPCITVCMQQIKQERI